MIPPRAQLMSRTPSFMRAISFGADHAAGLLRKGSVDGDEVGFAEQFFQAAHQADVNPLRRFFGDVGIVGHHLHPEGLAPRGHPRADPAQPDHPQGLAAQLDPHELAPGPLSLLDRGVRPGNIAAQGQHQAQGQLGGRQGVGLGGVHHQDPVARGGVDVDIIHPHPGAAGHLQPPGRLEDRGGQGSSRAGDHRVIIPDHLNQFFRTGEFHQIVLHVRGGF